MEEGRVKTVGQLIQSVIMSSTANDTHFNRDVGRMNEKTISNIPDKSKVFKNQLQQYSQYLNSSLLVFKFPF